jgi:molybdopterin-binding protein
MNILPGAIQNIQTHGNLTLVKVNVSGLVFTTIIIETPETVSYLKEGAKIKVMFKETEVIIGRNEPVISLQNRIPAIITDINQGRLLSQITLQYLDHSIGSIITSSAVRQLQLSTGDEVVAMIKTNEIMLSE